MSRYRVFGNGQNELFQILSGEILSEKKCKVNNKPIGNLNPQENF